MSRVYALLKGRDASVLPSSDKPQHPKVSTTDPSHVLDRLDRRVDDSAPIDSSSESEFASDSEAETSRSTTSSAAGNNDASDISHDANNVVSKQNKLAELRQKIRHVEVALKKERDANKRETLWCVLKAWKEEEEILNCESHDQSSQKTLLNVVSPFFDIIRVSLSLLSLVCDCDVKQSHHHICVNFWTWWRHMKFVVDPDMLNAFKVCYKSAHGDECIAETLRVAKRNAREQPVVAVNESLLFLFIKMKKATSDFVLQLVEAEKPGILENITDECKDAICHLQTLREPLQNLLDNQKWTEDIEKYSLVLNSSPSISTKLQGDSRLWQSPEVDYARMIELLSDHETIWGCFGGARRLDYAKEKHDLEAALELLQERKKRVDALL